MAIPGQEFNNKEQGKENIPANSNPKGIQPKVKIAGFSIFVILALIVFAYFYFSDKILNITQTVNAVPVNAGLIIQTKNFDKIIDNLKNGNNFWKSLTSIKYFNEVNTQINYLDALLKENSKIRSFIEDHPVVISAHQTGKDRIELLYALSLSNKSDDEKIKNTIIKILGNKGEVKERTYDNVLIYDARFNDKNSANVRDFTFCFCQGIFVFSFSQILVENSIRQMNSNVSLLKNSEFNSIIKPAGKNVMANIYLNYACFPKVFSVLLSNDTKKTFNSLNTFASWSSLELNLRPEAIQVSGITFTNDSTNSFLKALQRQTPQKTRNYKVLPDKTTCFIDFCISDFPKYLADYKNYLKKGDDISRREYDINQMKGKTDIDIESVFATVLKDEMTLVYIDAERKAKEYDVFFISKLKDKDEAEEKLSDFSKGISKKTKKNIKVKTTDKKSKKPVNSKFYKMPVENLIPKLFGSLFSSVESNFYTFYNEYIIFGSSEKSLKDYLNYLEVGRTLENDKNFEIYSNYVASNSNIMIYCQISQSAGMITPKLESQLSKTFTSNIGALGKFQALTLQFTGEKNTLNTNLFINRVPDHSGKTGAAWEAKLDTLVVSKVQLVSGSNKEKDIVLQDASNNLYLISNSGKILWKKKISDRVISDFYQIDYFKNDKLQVLFNTQNRIYLIDRNGNPVEGFPVKLKSPATNGISVFDFNKNRDYRILVANKDKRILMLNKDGKQIDGWTFGKTGDIVKSTIQYFIYDSKEYIVFADNINIYILNRKGESRVKPIASFPKSQNSKFFLEPKTERSRARLVTTNNSGEVHFIYLDGTITKMVLKNCTHNHYFEYIDLNNDGLREFVYLDGNTLEAYNRDKSKLFSYSFENEIDKEPRFFMFSKGDIKIGVVDSGSSLVYLLNSDGSIYNGFPVNGQSMFTIGSFSKNSKFHLIIGNKDNYLYNYQIL